VLLSSGTSQNLMKGPLKKITPFTAGIKNRFNAISSGLLSSLFSARKKDIKAVRGCNMAFWRDDVVKVNGFNEDFVGWGREDSEFVIRLLNQGIARRNLKFGGVAYHLYHPENARQSLATNDAILERAISEKSTFCPNGIDKHLPKN
jgi:GT2 family glycosyltransferase